MLQPLSVCLWPVPDLPVQSVLNFPHTPSYLGCRVPGAQHFEGAMQSLVRVWFGVPVFMYVCMYVCMYTLREPCKALCAYDLACLCLYMYICVCVYVCMYVCMYTLRERWKAVCAYDLACLCLCMYDIVGALISRMRGSSVKISPTDIWTHTYVYVCMYVCMYVCIYMCVYI
jgi:hypothetical protein